MHRWHLGPDPCLGLARLPISTRAGVATHLLGLGRLGGGPGWLGLGRGGSSLLLAWFGVALGTSSLGGGGTLGGLLGLGRGDRGLARLLLGWGLLGDEASGHGASALRASFYHGAQQQVIDIFWVGIYGTYSAGVRMGAGRRRAGGAPRRPWRVPRETSAGRRAYKAARARNDIARHQHKTRERTRAATSTHARARTGMHVKYFI